MNKIKKNKLNEVITFRITNEQKEKIKVISSEKKLTMSKIIIAALDEYLK